MYNEEMQMINEVRKINDGFWIKIWENRKRQKSQLSRTSVEIKTLKQNYWTIWQDNIRLVE